MWKVSAVLETRSFSCWKIRIDHFWPEINHALLKRGLRVRKAEYSACRDGKASLRICARTSNWKLTNTVANLQSDRLEPTVAKNKSTKRSHNKKTTLWFTDDRLCQQGLNKPQQPVRSSEIRHSEFRRKKCALKKDATAQRRQVFVWLSFSLHCLSCAQNNV